MRMLDQLHKKLRAGDYVLVLDPPFSKPVAAEVLKVYGYNSICVRFSDGRYRYFSSRDGFADILAGARHVDGTYVPL